jgi:hypothetical protein
MARELLGILGTATVASSCGILLILLLRKPLRTFFGPSLAYFLWLLVPTSILVPLLPAPSTGLKTVLPGSAFDAFTHRPRRGGVYVLRPGLGAVADLCMGHRCASIRLEARASAAALHRQSRAANQGRRRRISRDLSHGEPGRSRRCAT